MAEATPSGRGGSPILLFAAPAILTALSLFWAINHNDFQDFFIFRAGSVLGLRGESPYDPAKIRAMVAEQFPDAEMLIENCGYFLPPQAIALFAPFAAIPYPAAKILWAIANGLAAFACLLLPRLFGRSREEVERLRFPSALITIALLLSPTLTFPILIVGQYTLVIIGAVIAGQWCFDRGRPLLGAALWSLPFVKPHLAIALIPLAWYLGGWKRAAIVVAAVAVLNLAGCLMVSGSPLFFRDYIEFLGGGHKAVAFNRVELNPQMTGWNRLVFAFGGPLIELGISTTLAGYLIWFGLAAGRAAASGIRPSPAWAMAAAAVGSLFVCQVLGYETLLLALAVPWLLDLIATRRKSWAAVVVVLMLVQMIPPAPYLDAVESMALEARAAEIVKSFRAAGIAALAVVVLCGPLVRRDEATSTTPG